MIIKNFKAGYIVDKEKKQKWCSIIDYRHLVTFCAYANSNLAQPEKLTLLYWTTDHLTGEKNLKDLILEIEGVRLPIQRYQEASEDEVNIGCISRKSKCEK